MRSQTCLTLALLYQTEDVTKQRLLAALSSKADTLLAAVRTPRSQFALALIRVLLRFFRGVFHLKQTYLPPR